MDDLDVVPLSKFDLFGSAPYQNTIRERKVTQYLPLAQMGSSDIIEFVTPTPYDEYINLSESTMTLKLAIRINKPEK